MNPVFADTYYFFALLSVRDEAHHQALEYSRQFTGMIITTAWVITELADGMCSVRDRKQLCLAMDRMRSLHNLEILPPTAELFEAGWELYANRPDKEWSLTDCISFVVMQQHGITEALTGDHHFEQAGFVALLK